MQHTVISLTAKSQSTLWWWTWKECLEFGLVDTLLSQDWSSACPQIYVQVNKVCPALVSQVLSQITETVAEELSRLMSCVTKFSPSGSQQAHIDVTALQRCLKPFIDRKAQWVSCVFTIELVMKNKQVQEFNIRTSYS